MSISLHSKSSLLLNTYQEELSKKIQSYKQSQPKKQPRAPKTKYTQALKQYFKQKGSSVSHSDKENQQSNHTKKSKGKQSKGSMKIPPFCKIKSSNKTVLLKSVVTLQKWVRGWIVRKNKYVFCFKFHVL